MIGGKFLEEGYMATEQIKSSFDLLPTTYPTIWCGDAPAENSKATGAWIDDVTYYNVYDDGWKYYHMMSYRYDKEYFLIFTISNSKKKDKKYTHIYVSVGVVDEDVNIMELKVMGKSDNLPTFDDNGNPLNGVAYRLSNHHFLYSSQYGERYYLGEHENIGSVKWDILYISLWECWTHFPNIIEI